MTSVINSIEVSRVGTTFYARLLSSSVLSPHVSFFIFGGLWSRVHTGWFFCHSPTWTVVKSHGLFFCFPVGFCSQMPKGHAMALLSVKEVMANTFIKCINVLQNPSAVWPCVQFSSLSFQPRSCQHAVVVTKHYLSEMTLHVSPFR